MLREQFTEEIRSILPNVNKNYRLCDVLAYLRHNKEMTMDQVACKMGLATSVISNMESDSKKDYRISTISKLAIFYGVPEQIFIDLWREENENGL